MGVLLGGSISKEERQVLREQHALVQDDLAARDPPASVHPAQQVFALATRASVSVSTGFRLERDRALAGTSGGAGPAGAARRIRQVEVKVTVRQGRLPGPWI